VATTPPVEGTIVSVDALGNVTVATNATPSVQVVASTDASTAVTLNGQASTVSALAAGDLVKMEVLPSGLAVSIDARTPPPLEGTVVSVDASGNVTVATEAECHQPSVDVVVATNASTVVTLDGLASTVSALAAGDSVKIEPPTGTATSIVATTPHSHHHH
jgi:type IV secretory pathway TrbF-like protein